MNTQSPRHVSWPARMFLTFMTGILSVVSQEWTQISIQNITLLGPQLAPDVTNVSRDGGFSVLLNGNIVWLYDDSECLNMQGDQLSFISNTASFANQPNADICTVEDFGVELVGEDKLGNKEYAILANTTVGTGGWIPFQQDELEFNEQMKGKERVAICGFGPYSCSTVAGPGTSPMPISTTQALLFAPLVYVDSKPSDPSKEYQGRGMTLVSINAPSTGPVATRQGDIIIPGTQIEFGGFTALLGYPSTVSGTDRMINTDRDLYLLGVADGGLQLARVNVNDLLSYSKYTFFQPQNLLFDGTPPGPNVTDSTQIYLPGTFSSGSIFYSPYFSTFIMVYFNKQVDSTFYIRFLDLKNPISSDPIWIEGGKLGNGIEDGDAEALVKYAWSPEQVLYKSTPGPGGFNYAGVAHPEYFNRQYFAKGLYGENTPINKQQNAWYGSNVIAEADAGGDGRHLLISWTSQLKGGFDSGIYQIYLAIVEFGDLPAKNSSELSTTTGSTMPTTVAPSSIPSKKPIIPNKCGTNEKNCLLSDGKSLSSFLGYSRNRNYDLVALTLEAGLLVGVIGVVGVVF